MLHSHAELMNVTRALEYIIMISFQKNQNRMEKENASSLAKIIPTRCPYDENLEALIIIGVCCISIYNVITWNT